MSQLVAVSENSEAGSLPRWLTLGAMTFTLVAWASAFVVIRWLGDSFAPGPLAVGRLVVGSAALGALVSARRGWVRPTPREWLLLMICGLLWFAVYNVALNAAERSVDAGTTAMIINIGPILIAVFAGVWFGEGFPRWLVIGALIAFAGVVLIGASTASAGSADLTGVLLCVVAAVAYAIGVLTQKPVLRRLPALQVTFLACTVGAIACIGYVPGLYDDLRAASSGAIFSLAYLGLVPTALAFSAWAFALSQMNAGKLSIATYLVPPTAILMSWIVLGEVPAALAFVGGAVCLVGVALSRRTPRAS